VSKPLTLSEKLKILPEDPGVYLMLGSQGEVLYVGKAKILKNRVRSYFNKQHDPKTLALVSKIVDFKIIAVKSELDAFVLENNLIKKYRPPFNIELKDNKQYPYLKITWSEDFPRLLIARERKNDGDAYFGPFLGTGTIRSALSLIKGTFPYRTCGNPLPKRACLEYYIKNCEGPCIKNISKDQYRNEMKDIEKFLEGKYEDLADEIKQKMKEASINRKFEQAIVHRDQMKTIEKILQRQYVNSASHQNIDVLAVALAGEVAIVYVIKIRNFRMSGQESFTVVTNEISDSAQIFNPVFLEYYQKTTDLPEKIYIPTQIKEKKLLQDWIKVTLKSKIKISYPDREDVNNETQNLLRMAMRNAVLNAERERAEFVKKGNRQGALIELQSLLKMKQLPLTIEGFDISHIQGAQTVASMVSFHKGLPNKAGYRKFILKTVQDKPDDFASMREVVKRRYSRLLQEQKPLPDVILIDGGKGQLSAAMQSLMDLKLMGKVKIMSLAKQHEEIFLPGSSASIKLPIESQLLKMIQHVRDESHRFAITFHRQRRSKAQLNRLDKNE
jgi:excinuclease ABC subunit C